MQKYTIDKLRKEKKNSINVILFSIILSTAINIVAYGICAVFKMEAYIYIIFGVIIVISIIFGSILYRIRRLNFKNTYKGMFIINPIQNNRLMKISDYPISEDMSNYLYAAFRENEALRQIWEKGNLKKIQVVGVGRDKSLLAKCDESCNLLIELIEYCILKEFSVFISSYFDKLHMKSAGLDVFLRETIPDILLSNRFLSLFSERIENRAAFITQPKNEIKKFEGKSKTILMHNAAGAIYEYFDLYMPSGTKIYRESKNTIVFNTKLFVLKISCLYGGFNTVIERDFYKYHMGICGCSDFDEYEFDINVDVKYKFTSVFKVLDWKKYNWLDRYLDKIEHYCDKDTFLEDIHWIEQKHMIRAYKNFYQFDVDNSNK